jgi:tetratricopeptide (TPR) repeat protein
MNIDGAFQIAVAYLNAGDLQNSVKIFHELLKIQPNNIDVLYCLGAAYHQMNAYDAAIEYTQKAIQSDMRVNVKLHAYSLLENAYTNKGLFNEAYFYQQKALQIRLSQNFDKPVWDGFDISGLAILLHDDQISYGDVIQCIRYAPLVAQQSSKVILRCRKELKPLLQNVEGISEVAAHHEQLPEFDIQCPLVSLPLVLRTTYDNIPAQIPYISVDSTLVGNWKYKIHNGNDKLHVGLVWAGSTVGNYSLDMYSPLAKLDNIAFYSLQIGKASEEAKSPPKGMNLFDYTEEIHDFLDTAAFVMNLDLVISVDTSQCHLAGALGKPVWTLLPFFPDGRWLQNREDSPWYPTMKLFRQSSQGDWESVIGRVKDELLKLLDNN